MNNSSVWLGMLELTEKMLLNKAKPNEGLIEEALSFDAGKLDTIPISQLRKYIVVLGQYLISLQFEENRVEAEYSAWQRALDSRTYEVMRTSQDAKFNSIKTITEKKSWVVENDAEAHSFESELQISDAKRKIIRNMCKPVEQYINTLKKEIDARSGERKLSYE